MRCPVNSHPDSTKRSTCLWCGRTTHANRKDCPASNDTCHTCGKRGHWQQVCRASSIKAVSESPANLKPDPQETYVITHDVYHVQSAPKGIFVDLDSPTSSSPSSSSLRFQVDLGCSCNTIHVSDLNKLPPVPISPSAVHLWDYSKTIIPTRGETTLHCTRHGSSYDIVAQVITVQRYYPPLLGLTDSTRIGIHYYDVDNVHQLQTAVTPSQPLLGELTIDSIKFAYPHLFEGLGELDEL